MYMGKLYFDRGIAVLLLIAKEGNTKSYSGEIRVYIARGSPLFVL